MDRPASPRSILITGASSGIGEALALRYAAPGVHLCLTGRDVARLEAVVSACGARGADVDGHAVDVTDADAMRALVARADTAHPFDLVIANAGISGGVGGVLPGPAWFEDECRVFDINLGGVLKTVGAVLPGMMARGEGQIALMASLAAFSGWPGAPAYGASKGAVRLYGEALRGALAPYGIRVNVICPGFVKSRMTDANPFPMPFFMQTDPAADRIVRGLARDKARIAFPWPTYLIAGLVGLLPPALALLFTRRLPKKPALDGTPADAPPA